MPNDIKKSPKSSRKNSGYIQPVSRLTWMGSPYLFMLLSRKSLAYILCNIIIS